MKGYKIFAHDILKKDTDASDRFEIGVTFGIKFGPKSKRGFAFGGDLLDCFVQDMAPANAYTGVYQVEAMGRIFQPDTWSLLVRCTVIQLVRKIPTEEVIDILRKETEFVLSSTRRERALNIIGSLEASLRLRRMKEDTYADMGK